MTSPGLYPKTPTHFSRLISSDGNVNPSLSPVQHEDGSFNHPLGTKIFYRDYIVSFQNLTDRHVSIANHIFGECNTSRLPAAKDTTVCLHISEKGIEYYVVDHKSKAILWKTGQVPESFNNADPSKHEYEYWVHMMNFPGHRFSTSEDSRLLQDILSNNPPGGLCTVPEDLKTAFASFEHFDANGGLHQTYATDILEHVGKRVKSVTELFDLSQCDEYPTKIGGFGDVYSGKLRDGPRVAIKCLRLTINRDAEGRDLVETFANELYVWSKCNHPNVIGMVGMAKYRGQFAMVSPWMQNGNLEQFLSTQALSRTDRYQLCTQIVEGVAYLHENNIIHGDLKASNILMSDENIPQLTDFGSSIIREHSLQFRSSGIERPFTLRWVASEMLLDGKAKPTYNADIHSLGMTILEIMTGNVPYADAHGLAVYGKIINGVLPNRPEKHIPTGDSQADYLWSLLTNGCWEFKPRDRITAAMLRDKMRGYPSIVANTSEIA